jgi:hypothetical protein
MKKIFLLSVLSVVLISCEKENKLIFENTDVPLLSRVLFYGENYHVYSYYVNNLICEEKSKFFYTKHNYDDKNQLTKSEYYYDPGMVSSTYEVFWASMNRKEWVNPDNTRVSLTKTYEYENDGQLIRVRYIRPSSVKPEYTEFTFENGMINRKSMYWQNALSSYIEYSYDSNGNLLKAEKYQVSSTGEAKLLTVNEYEYDDMRNPFQSFRRLITPGKYTNPNNITRETYTTHIEIDPGMQKVSVTNYTYEYNDMGYPVKVNGETEYVYNK